MKILILLIPVSLCLGVAGLLAFLWSLRSGQYDDPAGDAERILLDTEDRPLRPGRTSANGKESAA